MKLDIDLSNLWASVRNMEVPQRDFDLGLPIERDWPEIDDELASLSGTSFPEIKLNPDNGVLGVHGRQVLLFIPNHGNKVMGALADENKGKRFHVADCKTLEEKRQRNELDRYRATYNITGQFLIHGTSPRTGQSVKDKAKLKVCKHCLAYLNYKGYRTASKAEQERIHQSFDISAFLSEYSTLFRNMPGREVMIGNSGYSSDWKQVSEKYRQSARFQCESCRVDLSEHRHLLHTHHINRNKSDNRDSNLQALCLDCHRKQPMHEYMRVKHTEMTKLTHLRKKQGLLKIRSWNDVICLADQALEGLLKAYQEKQLRIPEIGYELLNSDGSLVATLDVAWPKQRKGIAIDNHDLIAAKTLGWHAVTLGEALSRMNEG